MAVIRRSEWGAGGHRAPRIGRPVNRLFLHHTVTPQWVGIDAARRIQRIAFDRGFADISYSWLIDVDGNQIEGRGWGRRGAHTVGYNSSAHAISLIGDFDRAKPPDKMLRALANLVRKHGDGGHGPGRITHGHRDVSTTACPGRHAYSKIATVNDLVRTGDLDPEEDDFTMFCERGDKNQAVGALQLELRELGVYTGDIDNDYGPKTAAAVLAMRRSVGSSAEDGDAFNKWAYHQLGRALYQHRAGGA